MSAGSRSKKSSEKSDTNWNTSSSGAFAKSLEKADAELRERAVKAIARIVEDPYAAGEKLQGAANRYKRRVGDNRIVYSVYKDEKLIDFERFENRGEVYRRMKRRR